MADEPRRIATVVGMNTDAAKKLDQILAGPNDRAYVICTVTDCKLNSKGHCTIFAVLDVPPMKTGQPCERYEKA